jgi:hypothetical protein
MATATKDYWIQTISGKKFSYLDPQPESIFGIAIPVQRFRSCDAESYIKDIPHPLSQYQYNGLEVVTMLSGR